MRPNITLNYGLRWDAQTMPETVDPATTAYRGVPERSDVSHPTARSRASGACGSRALGVAWDVKGDGKSVVRASWGVYYARQNMLSQVGSVTTNGLQQQTIFASTANMHGVRRADADVARTSFTPTPLPDGQFPLFSGVRVFDRDYKNPHIFAFNVAYEQELAPDWAAYADFIWNEGTRPDAVPQLQPQRSGVLRRRARAPATPTSTTGTRGSRSSTR